MLRDTSETGQRLLMAVGPPGRRGSALYADLPGLV